MNKKISAQIVADSIDGRGNRITTFLLTYPRFIHGELMTHRMFSRNSASSRAIPFKKMVEMVEEDPFIPIAWQKDHKGMQGTEYIERQEAVQIRELQWLQARDSAIHTAKELNSGFVFDDGQPVTKQLCNRLLEPFMWHTVLVTATEWNNFFELRCPRYVNGYDEEFRSRKDYLNGTAEPEMYPKTEEQWWKLSQSNAEIHIQALAETMWDQQQDSIPKKLLPGEYHVPFFEIEED